jgi:hypothetical protein
VKGFAALATMAASLVVTALTPAQTPPAESAAVRHCGKVVITPNSGDGLTKIRASGISCRSARRKLRAWGKNEYQPTTGPRGYRCRSVGNTVPGRVKCRRKGHRLPVISFLSGT